MKTFRFRPLLFLVLLVSLSATGCQSTYYKTMEQFGRHKRDILVRRVDSARDSQEKAKEQFQTVLERLEEVTGFTGGELRQQYDRLQAEFRRSESRASDVRHRIASVDQVAQDLFTEWETELEQYSNGSLRQRSEQQLRQTRGRYEQLIATMRQAESRMDPVLNAFRDRVLFLKHNLNARAIADLEGTSFELEQEISDLIKEMDRAIDEANAFIQSMRID